MPRPVCVNVTWHQCECRSRYLTTRGGHQGPFTSHFVCYLITTALLPLHAKRLAIHYVPVCTSSLDLALHVELDLYSPGRPQKNFVRNFFSTHIRPVRPPGGALIRKHFTNGADESEIAVDLSRMSYSCMLITQLRRCLSVCPRFGRKTGRAINSKLGSHTVHGSRSACSEREVRRSKVKVTRLWERSRYGQDIIGNVGRCWYCTSVGQLCSTRVAIVGRVRGVEPPP